mgnify:CR=1 FL=1
MEREGICKKSESFCMGIIFNRMAYIQFLTMELYINQSIFILKKLSLI